MANYKAPNPNRVRDRNSPAAPGIGRPDYRHAPFSIPGVAGASTCSAPRGAAAPPPPYAAGIGSGKYCSRSRHARRVRQRCGREPRLPVEARAVPAHRSGPSWLRLLT